jgi:hypothetical protein
MCAAIANDSGPSGGTGMAQLEANEPPSRLLTRGFMLWLPSIDEALTALLVSAVVYHGRSLGLDVTVAEVHDLWLTTPKVIVTGSRRSVRQFESDVLRGCTFLETGGLRDIDPRSEPLRYTEAFANWLAQQSDGRQLGELTEIAEPTK